MFCSNCKSELQAGAAFCAECGTSTAGEGTTGQVSPRPFDEGKELVKKRATAKGDNGGTVDGTLILAENALVFKPSFYQLGSGRTVAPLLDIAEIEKNKALFVLNTEMKVFFRSGGNDTFYLSGRDAFINALEDQIKKTVEVAMLCNNCRTQLPITAKFCSGCGIKAESNADKVIYHVTGCSYCGEILSEGIAFCSKCGKPVEGKEPSQTTGEGPFWLVQANESQLSDDKLSLSMDYYKKFCSGPRYGHKNWDAAIETISNAIKTNPLVLDFYFERGYQLSYQLARINNFLDTDIPLSFGKKKCDEYGDLIIKDMNKIIDSLPHAGMRGCLPGCPFFFRGFASAEKEKAIADLDKAVELGIGLNGRFFHSAFVEKGTWKTEEQYAGELIYNLKHGTIKGMLHSAVSK